METHNVIVLYSLILNSVAGFLLYFLTSGDKATLILLVLFSKWVETGRIKDEIFVNKFV
jgi:hypothetical protein